jgi:hypothetical protein
MQTITRIPYAWRGRITTLKRVHVVCAYCGANLLRSTTRAKRKCFCSMREALLYRYEHNLVDRSEIVRAAHATLEAQEWRRGISNSRIAGDNNPAKREESRAKISAAKLESNWMRGRFGKLHHLYQGGKIWWRGKDWNQTKLRVRQRDGFMCVQCDMTEWQHSEQFGQPLQVDHIVLYRISHDNSMHNLQTLCCTCHGKKKRDETIVVEQCRELLAA